MNARGTRGPTRADVAEAAAALDAVDAQLVELAARLPMAPVDVLARFLNRDMSTTYRRTRSLLDGGLVGAAVSPLRTAGRPARLLWATDFGLAVLAQRRAGEPAALAELLGRRTRPALLPAELPGMLAVYELLGLLAATRVGTVTLRAWERPWRRAIPPRAGRAGQAMRPVRLPAAATLAWNSPGETVAADYLLVPDTGGLALPALRSTLGRLAEHQAASSAPPNMIIATTTPRRAKAWSMLLETVCRARGTPALTARLVLWDDLRRAPRSRGSASALPTLATLQANRSAGVSVPALLDGSIRSVHRIGRILHGGPALCTAPVVAPLDRVVLDLIGRHPFLPTDNLAALLGRDGSWVRTRQTTLVARGLLRVVPAEEVTPPELARRTLLELTHRGLDVLAAHLGLPLGVAVRHHGLAGGGPTRPVGPRAALLAHLFHTLGADAVFASLAQAVRIYPAGGALLEWRGASACGRGRFRPDGYGLLRLGRQQHGFFLEFDRGSMRPGRLRAKFAAYHRYRAGDHAARSYAGFPTLLVVTTGPGAEQRLARALRAADAGQGAPLSALLTTTGLLETTHGGPLGPVWRTAADPTRRRAWA